MTQKCLSDSSGFPASPTVLSSFASKPAFFELSGPWTLVRLVQFKKVTYDGLRLDDSRRDGLFWFDEELLVRVRNRARIELLRQQAEARRPFAAPLDALVTLYLRHYFRAGLAVCKDWTNDFDGYVRLRLLAGDRLIALVGQVAKQPAYSPNHPQYRAVLAQGIWLEGRATQYVIDFEFSSNRAYRPRIQGPFGF